MTENTISALVAEARDLIGDSAKHNPEYARGIVELLASLMSGSGDDAKINTAELLRLDPADYV